MQHPGMETGQATGAIAVIGMACRFPGDATDIENFWAMLRDARDAWSEIPTDRFNAKGWYHPDPNRPGSFHIRGAHFIKGDISAFDAPFFSISTAEAVSMDPQQRMLLEVVYEALDSAGIPVTSLSNTATNVFCGSFVRDYEQPCMRDPDTTPPYSATGNGIAILANRISHAFDFAGTSQTIDTGCSASMIAVHQACKSLISGESCLGIAAGVGLIFSPNTLVPMANLNILSPDGRCFTFDERANGYGRGEGVGVVVLKRLEDAIAANDTIRAVIRATATNQDGHTQGLTLPSKERQIQNMTGIYRNAGLDISRTTYVECHGTGTRTGDLKEAEAVSEVFCRHRTPDNPLTVGSVKTNIGHLEGSAGVAGLLKGILVAERGYIPKHLNFHSPNSNIDFRDLKLQVASDLTPFPTSGLRRVSVNSFGFGGTNAHVVLDDAAHFLAEHHISGGQHVSFIHANDQLSTQETNSSSLQNRLFVFSGHDESGLNRVLSAQSKYIEANSSQLSLENYAYTLLSRRSALNWRTFVVAASADELLLKLQKKDVASPFRMPSQARGNMAFVFSGQGAQWHAMGRELFCYAPFRSSVAAASRFMEDSLQSPFNLWDELYSEAASSRIDLPQIAQPATTAIQVALVDLLAASNVRPAAVVGHSSGEIAAAYAFGAISREDAWKIAFYRGQCVARISALGPGLHGGMLAVALSEENARWLIAEAGVDTVGVACINGPASVTLSGDASGISALCAFFEARGIRSVRVNVDVAYHSEHMHIVQDVYLDAIKDVVPLQKAGGKFFSSVLGREALATDLHAQYWVDNLVLPVHFYEAVTEMLVRVKPVVLIEVSPHRVWKSTLCQICSQVSAKSTPFYASLLCRGKDASTTALGVLGELWMRGFAPNLDWTHSSEARPRHLVDVPSYPWDHSRKYWHESHLSKANRFRAHGREDLIGAPLENSTPQFPRWRGFFRVQENPWLEDHVIQKSIIYPAGGMVVMAIEAAKQVADAGRKVLGYEVLDFSIVKPMLIPRSTHGLENMLSANLVCQENSCYDFTILSKPEGDPWTVHAKGRFAVLYEAGDGGLASPEDDQAKHHITKARQKLFLGARGACRTRYNARQFYECLDVVGMTYGPQFRNLTEICTNDAAAYTVVQIPDTKSCMPFGFEFDHIIHPATLDTMLQTVLAMRSQADEAMLPCSAGRIFVSASLPRGAGSQFRGCTTASKTSTHAIRADISMFDYALENTAVTIENLVLKSAPSHCGGFLPANRHLCTEIVWKTDISSLSALGADFPATVESLVDLCAHKKPNLSISCHISDESATNFAFFSLILDTLTAGYETPRFSQLTVTGSEAFWKAFCAQHRSRAGLERVRFLAELPAGVECDVTLCSVGWKAPNESCVAQLCQGVAPDGWLALVPTAEGSAFSPEQRNALVDLVEIHGCRSDSLALPGLVCAQKTPAVARHFTKTMTVVLPDEMSDFVHQLKEAVRPILEEELSTEIVETPLSAIHSLPRGGLANPCLCLAELDGPVVFSMGRQTFDLVQRLLTQAKGVLWLTRGAQQDVADPLRHPFIGLARAVRSEDGKKRITCLDVANGELSLQGIARSIALLARQMCAGDSRCCAADDVEYVYCRGRLLIPRLMPLTVLNRLIEYGPSSPPAVASVSLAAGKTAWKLDAASVGTAFGPLFVEDADASRPLCPGEVRIAVASTNLTPADVSGACDQVGTDVFGRVVEAGASVRELWVGCSVLVQMRGTLCTHVITHQSRVRRAKHSGSGWQASCPTALAAALHALPTQCSDQGGESILIYAVQSVYGQAMFRLAAALHLGILVACASPAERTFAQDCLCLHESQVVDLHGPGNLFAGTILALTCGRGVDIVFDPTSKHLDQAFECVAEGGRVIRVAWPGSETPPIRLAAGNASLETVNLELLAQRRPAAMRALAHRARQTLEVAPGLCALSGVSEYPLSRVGEALKAAAADPFGRPCMVTAGGGSVNVAVTLAEVRLSASGTYLIVGGLGGLGRAIAQHFVARGARHLAFFSRTGAASKAARDLLGGLWADGVDARAFSVDIARKESLAAGLEELRSRMPAIQGAVQCAAVVSDSFFPNMDYECWQACVAPKIAGSYNLHVQLPPDMDFFIFLSSLSGVVGNRGQANYAAANSFQDALARHRSGRGMHSVSLDFGLVLDAGMVAEDERLLEVMRSQGFLGTRLQDVLVVLERAIAGEALTAVPAQVVMTAGTGGLVVQNAPGDPFWTRAALFRYVNQVDAPADGLWTRASKNSAAAGSLRTLLQGAESVEHATQMVCTGLIGSLARRKSMVPEDFDAERLLGDYGIDSLDSLFVLGWITRETGVTMQTLEGMTIGELSHTVASRCWEGREMERPL